MTTDLFDEDTLPPDVVRAFGDIRRPQRTTYSVTWGAASERGADRDTNQDVWGQRDARCFVVADGMGGREGGAGAAATAVGCLLDELASDRDGVDWPEAIARVNEAVVRHGRDAGHRRVGAAAAALRYRGSRLTVVHLGDVRAYRLRHGQIELLTTDHTLAEELDRAGVAAAASRKRLARQQLAGLTTFFGDPGSSDGFGVRSLSVQRGDRIALCTDGVYRHVPASSWRQAAQGDSPQAVAELLVGTARAHGTTDDATAMVIAFAQDSERP
jgi:serine/threonine protein phosphatase PrpC